MKKNFIVLLLTVVSAVACRKNDGGTEPPIVDDTDTLLYNVTTVMNVEGQVSGMAIADDGTIFYSVEDRIYKIKDSVKSLIAGAETGYQDGNGAAARFNYPGMMDLDAEGNLYVADRLNKRVRKIDKSGNVSTLVFSYVDTIYNKYGEITDIVHDTTSMANGISDLNIKGNHLYLLTYSSGIVKDYNAIRCRLDSNNFVAGRYDLFMGATLKTFDITEDERFLYWCNIYGIDKLDLTNGQVTSTSHYDTHFINFALGERGTVIYKPRLDRCVIDKMTLATETDSTIAGKATTAPMNIPNPSIDGIGTSASFNHVFIVKKKKNYLYIAEADYMDTEGGKIRKMRIP